MRNFYKKIAILLSLIPFLVGSTPVLASGNEKPLVPVQEMVLEVKVLDPRARVLHDYLSQFNSPLATYAQDFVDAADLHKIDWKLVPSIAGVESTFGKFTPGSDLYPSYNGWGWGVYGDQAIYFKSWKEAIYTISEGLKKEYIDKGLLTPYQINPKYAASKTWGSRVDYFMKDITKFAQKYNLEHSELSATFTNLEQQTSGASGKLALK